LQKYLKERRVFTYVQIKAISKGLKLRMIPRIAVAEKDCGDQGFRG
jgi:hypothetical protein